MLRDNVKVLRLGFYDYVHPCVENIQSFRQCPDIRIQSIIYWLKFFWKDTIELFVYPCDNNAQNETLLRDLETGFIDIVPDWVVKKEYFEKFNVITPLDYHHFAFYAKLPSAGQDDGVFLFSPFSALEWIAFISVFILIKLLLTFIFRFKHFQSSVVRIYLHHIHFVFASFIVVLYSSRLKAILTVSSKDLPFENIHDLAQKISDGKRVIYLESNNTHRWSLLMDDNFNDLDELIPLKKVIKLPGSVKIIPDSHKICELMQQSEEVVYFAYENLMEIKCSNFCFWKYKISKSYMSSNLISKKFRLFETANMFYHTVDMFRENTLKIKLYQNNCDYYSQDTTEMSQIGIQSLLGVFLGYTLMLLCLAFVLLLEIAKSWIERYVGYRFYQILNSFSC